MTVIYKDVKTLTEIQSVTGQQTKALVMYDTSTGEAAGLDVEVLIKLDAEKADTTQVEALDAAKVNKTGNETIAGVKTFSSSPVVPTPTTDMQASTKKYGDDILAAYGVDVNNVCGAVNHYKRVLADSGSVLDRTQLLKVYTEYIKQRTETVRLYLPEVGAKLRTSGLNRYGMKAYDLSTNQKDAVQLTDATQPYMTVGAAPNARLGMRFVQGQTQTGLMDFEDVAFAAGNSWTLTKRIKINNKGTARVYLGSAYIESTATTIVLHSGSVAVLTGTYNFECGKTYTIEFQYSNGAGLILINGLPIATTVTSAAVTFGQISYSTTYPADRVLYAFHLTNTRKSTAQSQLDHQFLSLFFPEVEGIAIGNQFWSTDNFCGTVAGDGTVIPEVQPSTPAELIIGGDFESGLIGTLDNSSGGATVTWTLNTSLPIAGTQDGRLVCSVAGTNSDRPVLGFPVNVVTGKRYVFRMAYKLNSGVFILQRVLLGAVSAEAFSAGMSLIGSGTMCFQFVANTTGTVNIVVNPRGTNIFDVQFDAVSLSELSSSDSTVIYNAVYAQTTGTAAVKDLAATKAAAMWCHYDNSAANGAVYGKLYNWYAVHLFDLYTPMRGWRVPSKLDFDQLVAANGGVTVAGGKLKAKFGGFDNAFATNESGFSYTPSGQRADTGVFENITNTSYLWTSTSGVMSYVTSTVLNGYVDTGKTLPRMMSIRMLRNEPAGANELSYTSGLFTTDITSAAKQIPISFGRMVDAIRIKSENALTAIEAKLYNAAGTAVATLITAKTIGAGETKMFAVSADWVSLLQDGTVRVTASGNSGAAVGMEIEVLTHKGVLS